MTIKNLFFILLCSGSISQANASKIIKVGLAMTVASTSAYALYTMDQLTQPQEAPDIFQNNNENQSPLNSVYDQNFESLNASPEENDNQDDSLWCTNPSCTMPFSHAQHNQENDDDNKICDNLNCALPYPHKNYLCKKFCK